MPRHSRIKSKTNIYHVMKNMTGTLDFSNATDPSLYDKLKDAYKEERRNNQTELKSEWTFDDKKRKSTFRWVY